MAWVILEGIDRSGKSTVAELYKAQGYEVVHMSAPSKKYTEKGYVGPSYLDDLLEDIMKYDGKDVVWDRSWYGEAVWPHVYGRNPMLSDDDIEVIQEFESRNQTEKIMMIDPDQQSHWKRCVDNKEPLNHSQFMIAGRLYSKLVHKYNFIPRQLSDFKNVSKTEDQKQVSPTNEQAKPVPVGQSKTSNSLTAVSSTKQAVQEAAAETQEEKLERANAINEVLSSRLIKKKGEIFDQLENDVKNFLRVQLGSIFNGPQQTSNLSEDEVMILKVFCQRLKEKEGTKK